MTIEWSEGSFRHFDALVNTAIIKLAQGLGDPFEVTLGVSGGREFFDYSLTSFVLNRVAARLPVTTLIHGNAHGADTLGKQWAERNGLEVRSLPARWKRDGNWAGPKRNTELLERLIDADVSVLVVFPGGDGTADMHWKSIEAGVNIIDVPLYLTQSGVIF